MILRDNPCPRTILHNTTTIYMNTSVIISILFLLLWFIIIVRLFFFVMSMLLVDCMIIQHTIYIHNIYPLYIHPIYIHTTHIYILHIGDDQNPWTQQRPGESRQICTWTGFFNWWTLCRAVWASVGWWSPGTHPPINGGNHGGKDPMKPWNHDILPSNLIPGLVNVYITMENHHANGKTHSKLQFSIANC